MDAKRTLEKIKLCDLKIKNTIEEIENLREIAESITPHINPTGLSGIKKSSYSDKVGDSVIKIIDLERRQQEELKKAMDYRM